MIQRQHPQRFSALLSRMLYVTLRKEAVVVLQPLGPLNTCTFIDFPLPYSGKILGKMLKPRCKWHQLKFHLILYPSSTTLLWNSRDCRESRKNNKRLYPQFRIWEMTGYCLLIMIVRCGWRSEEAHHLIIVTTIGQIQHTCFYIVVFILHSSPVW